MTVFIPQPAVKKTGAIAVAVAVAAINAVSICACAPCFADDDSADFFKFKNSDFFDIDVRRPDLERKKKAEEERDDEKRRKVDDKWTNRPDNPKNVWQETFVDTDFRMKTFRDLTNNNDLNALARAGRKDFGSRKDEDARHADDDLDFDKSDRDHYRRRMKEDEFRTFRDLTAPIPGMLHDWVPSNPDRGQNGAFTGAPDNGAVVPYKLNGWVEIQRKLPWEAEP